MWTDGRTDRYYDANSRVSQFLRTRLKTHSVEDKGNFEL